jgi:hypothetical protein
VERWREGGAGSEGRTRGMEGDDGRDGRTDGARVYIMAACRVGSRLRRLLLCWRDIRQGRDKGHDKDIA